MRILHLAPLWFPVARDTLGGIESYLPGLIKALGKLECENTLIASADSRTEAVLVPVVARNLYDQMSGGTAEEYIYYEQHQFLLALELAEEFDVVHSHVGPAGYWLSGLPGLRGRVLHTHHNPVTRDLEWFVHDHPDNWFSTVSEFQARKFWRQGATRCAVIPNGLDASSFTFDPKGGRGLIFLGRMEEEKGPDLAVQIAHDLNLPLILAGPIIDEEFFERTLRPYLNDTIRYVGVVDHHKKNALLGKAGCALLPSRCEEGFGMVSIEAMACGTPVVALANGALPEVIEHGLTGFSTSDEQALAPLVTRAFTLDRSAIRARVAARFDLARTAEKYRDLYSKMTDAAASAWPGHANLVR